MILIVFLRRLLRYTGKKDLQQMFNVMGKCCCCC